MRRELTSMEKQLAVRRRALSDAKSVEESFDGDVLAGFSYCLLLDAFLSAGAFITPLLWNPHLNVKSCPKWAAFVLPQIFQEARRLTVLQGRPLRVDGGGDGWPDFSDLRGALKRLGSQDHLHKSEKLWEPHSEGLMEHSSRHGVKCRFPDLNLNLQTCWTSVSAVLRPHLNLVNECMNSNWWLVYVF